MEKKTSSVEWLVNKLFADLDIEITNETNPVLFNLIQQAIEMHREEIERAVTYGMAESVRERYSDKKLSLKPKGEEQKYYNETFKG